MSKELILLLWAIGLFLVTAATWSLHLPGDIATLIGLTYVALLLNLLATQRRATAQRRHLLKRPLSPRKWGAFGGEGVPRLW
jgi:hypothetical protein